MKVLLHICCAPCLLYPLERLRDKGHTVEGLFFNPNIHPFAEYKSRREALENTLRELPLNIIFPEYSPAEFFQAVHLEETSPQRCQICWRLRLEKSARVAKERGFDAFCTTLLVSPYQDQQLLKSIGSDICRQQGIEFYYEDFRPGFRKAHTQARAKGIYCQKYCGCLFSEIERCRKPPKA